MLLTQLGWDLYICSEPPRLFYSAPRCNNPPSSFCLYLLRLKQANSCFHLEIKITIILHRQLCPWRSVIHGLLKFRSPECLWLCTAPVHHRATAESGGTGYISENVPAAILECRVYNNWRERQRFSCNFHAKSMHFSTYWEMVQSKTQILYTKFWQHFTHQ